MKACRFEELGTKRGKEYMECRDYLISKYSMYALLVVVITMIVIGVYLMSTGVI